MDNSKQLTKQNIKNGHPAGCSHCMIPRNRTPGVPKERVDPPPSCSCHKESMRWLSTPNCKAGGRWICRVRDNELRTNVNLRLRGIDRSIYNEMLKQQNGGCAICGTSPEDNGKALALDHDHSTGVVRGLLCHFCNITISTRLESHWREILAYLNINVQSQPL